EANSVSRRCLRPVSLVSVVAFLIANTPYSAVAMRCPWVLSSVVHAAPQQGAQQDTSCCSCCGEKQHQADCPKAPEAQKPQPLSGGDPCCPYGCCWCSIGKVPCP